MTLKVLACSGSLDGGGSERQLWQLVSNLPPSEFNCELFLVYRRGLYLNRLPREISVHAFSDVETRRFSLRGRLPGSIHRAQVGYVAELIRSCNIDIVYDRTYHMTLITGQACRRSNCPRVSVIVSPPSYDFTQGRERFKWFKYRILRRAYSDPSSRTICVSQAVADDAASFYRLPAELFRVIQSPVDIDGVQKLSQQAHQKDDSNSTSADNEQRFRIVVVGRMTSEKGHAFMIDFAKHWQTMRTSAGWQPLLIEFIGDGPLLANLQAKVQEAGLASEVSFRGFQENPFPWVAKADLVCIPSLYEGLPNIALEAMALRRPLAATNCSPALQSLVGSGGERGQLFDSRDPASLAHAVFELLLNKQIVNQRCESAFQWVRQHHSLNNWLGLMSEQFVELANKS